MTLRDTQRLLAEALQRPASLTLDAESVRTAEGIAAGNDRLSPVEQVDIYREQFWLRHVDVLRDDFASIEHALTAERTRGEEEEGEEDAFLTLAQRYLGDCPQAAFSLRDLGVGMPEFLARREPWSSDSFLVDLARVEWAFVEAFDGPDAPPFDPASIVGISEDAWPSARIGLHPSLQRLTLAYPAHDYRIAVRKQEPVSRPEPRPCHVVVYRGRTVLHCQEVDADAAAMLEQLAQGAPLGEACERAATLSGVALESFQTKLASWFSAWTALGWIRTVRFEGDPA
jgi:hypothetical protein